MATYEDAVEAIKSADKDEWTLPAYSGGLNDLSYLRQYVTDCIFTKYNVSPDLLTEATLFSTTILRDFVHRAVYQSTTRPNIEDLLASGATNSLFFDDVALLFRYGAQGLCGSIAWQEYNVFRAFGFSTNYVHSTNAEAALGDYSFNDAHVSTEVFLADLDKFIIQDATFNFLVRDANAVPLSFAEARQARFAENATLTFDNLDIYTWFQYPPGDFPLTGGPIATLPTTYPGSFLHDGWLKVVFAWRSAVGSDERFAESISGAWALPFYIPPPSDAQSFATLDEAVATVQHCRDLGLTWLEAASAIRNEHYVTGFGLVTPTDIDAWLTVGLKGGLSASINFSTGKILNGSYEQIVNEATEGEHILNAGQDLSQFLSPALLLAADGRVFGDWLASFTKTANKAPTDINAILAPSVLDSVLSATFDDGGTIGAYFGTPILTVMHGSPSGNTALEMQASSARNVAGNFGGVWFTADTSVETVGALYRVSYFAKAIDGAGTIVFDHQDGNGVYSSLQHTASLTTDWQYFVFDATLDAIKNYFYVYSTLADLHWVMDDIKVDRIGAPSHGMTENVAAGAHIATLSTFDSDSSTSLLTYSLIDDVAGVFQIIGNRIFLKPGAILTYEDVVSAQVTVRVTDETGAFYEESITMLSALNGTYGGDVLVGGPGDDHLHGMDGDDTLIGGLGSDTLVGGACFDFASYELASLGVCARLDLPSLNTAEAQGDHYIGIEGLRGSHFADLLCGNAGVNRLFGGNDNDSLWGYGGGDILDGGNGNDYLVGAAGADTFIGGAGSDTVSYYFAASAVTAYLGSPASNKGEAAGDTYNGVENVYGSQFADTLVGDADANSLYGWNGDDRLIGGSGNDSLLGGNGADTFIFDPGFGRDTVHDFQVAGGNHDLISIDDSIVANYADLMSVASQIGSNVVINLTATDAITAINVSLTSLQPDHFMFV
jgi:Ca2+-binding RTX toxin-like protein